MLFFSTYKTIIGIENSRNYTVKTYKGCFGVEGDDLIFFDNAKKKWDITLTWLKCNNRALPFLKAFFKRSFVNNARFRDLSHFFIIYFEREHERKHLLLNNNIFTREILYFFCTAFGGAILSITVDQLFCERRMSSSTVRMIITHY